MKNEFELTIKFDKELQQVHIEDGYTSCTYANVITEKDIAESIEDFIKNYEVEGSD